MADTPNDPIEELPDDDEIVEGELLDDGPSSEGERLSGDDVGSEPSDDDVVDAEIVDEGEQSSS